MDSNSDANVRPRLQFETAVEASATTPAPSDQRVVRCAACQQTISDAYFDVNGATVCAVCHGEIARHAETPRGAGVLVRALVFGLLAAIAGATLYYAVIAITNFEIGIVAIAIGYMVGFAVRKGAGGGGRRFQVIALVLTYWAVGLAYMPLAFRDAATARRQQQQAERAGAAVQASEQNDTGEGRRQVGLTWVLAFLGGLSFALPVLVVIGSLPGGIISAAIIGFGMLQAWRMTGTPQLVMTGPYRIATDAPAAS